MLKKPEQSLDMLSKDMQNIFKIQSRLQRGKLTHLRLKKMLEGINSKLNIVEQRLMYLKTAIESIQMKRTDRASRSY
jgi:hypothetical protein